MAKYAHPSNPKVNAGLIDKDKNNKAIEYLSNSDSITIVLGAGTSLFYKLPTWDILLLQLFKKTRKVKITDNLKFQFELLKKNFDNPSLAQYITDDPTIADFKHLKTELYKNFINSAPMISPLHYEIIQLLKRKKKTNIITYNFDGILEYFIEKEGIPFNISYGKNYQADINSLNIYHIHGYLPVSAQVTKDIALTFSEFQYVEQYNNVYSWQNQVQLSNFSNVPCVFLGLSFTDPNLKKLLFTCKKMHSVRHFRLDVPFNLHYLEEQYNTQFNYYDIKSLDFPKTIEILNDGRLELTEKLKIELLNFQSFQDFPEFIKKII